MTFMYADRPLPEIWAEEEEAARNAARHDPKLREVIARFEATDRLAPRELTPSYEGFVRALALGKGPELAVKHLASWELPLEAREWRKLYNRASPRAPEWWIAYCRSFSEACWAELRARR